MTNPLAGLEKTVGKDMLHKIQTSNILCVGAGGIGCELLKDLALSGFRRVQVIDLDTIDVSNLNRQLLFRSKHVGMAKCIVACQVAAEMVPPLSVNEEENDSANGSSNGNSSNLPKVTYQAHHGNVCDTSKFNVPFVKQFDLVLNALDNVEARRRVNRLCLAANIPLIEAGTTGYLGQVTVIHKGSGVACYECKTQETQKVYPICTIRSTPSMPVHTIVWAKELYKLLFHSKVEESMLFEDPASDEPSTYMEGVFQLREQLANSTFDTKTSKQVLQDLYATEIQKQLDMDRYKAAKKTPTCLDLTMLENGMQRSAPTTTTEIWSLEDSVAALAACIQQASQTPKNELLQEFDKDDDLAMRFVTAASNLRSSVFGIEPLQSLYSAKGIAGNIIPAIATTNAICAGLQILQAFKILKQQLLLEQQQKDRAELQLGKTCLYVNCIRNRTRNGLYLTASALEDPNPNCFVCKNAVIPLALNVEEWTLQDFLERIVKKRLGFEEPTLMLQGDFIWEEGDGAEDDYQVNLPKKLTALPCGGIQHGTVLEIDDNSQNLSIQVSVTHQDVWEGDEVPDFPFSVGNMPVKKKEEEKPTSSESASAAAVAKPTDDDDDVVEIIDDDEVTTSGGDRKRPAEDGGKSPPRSKRRRVKK
ncbi:UBA/THIF-type NAD/FAD binding protein [Nitzschia inconspicua]|uniref:SUMO-activating enzyme subunit n=1 Tax=Nitzschia inconspicua TaxID=303405 RepID=A0A9K3PPD2_9STRA|nr:UBA/THIF-type NAD/FAD binding protein [Nitzschia inconspicua]